MHARAPVVDSYYCYWHMLRGPFGLAERARVHFRHWSMGMRYRRLLYRCALLLQEWRGGAREASTDEEDAASDA